MIQAIIAKATADAALMFELSRLDSRAKHALAQLESDRLLVLFSRHGRGAEYEQLYEAGYLKAFVGEWDRLVVKQYEEAEREQQI